MKNDLLQHHWCNGAETIGTCIFHNNVYKCCLKFLLHATYAGGHCSSHMKQWLWTIPKCEIENYDFPHKSNPWKFHIGWAQLPNVSLPLFPLLISFPNIPTLFLHSHIPLLWLTAATVVPRALSLTTICTFATTSPSTNDLATSTIVVKLFDLIYYIP